MELLINLIAGRMDAGDVIVACPDGWQWSAKERSNPEWRIVRADILPTLAVALTVPGANRYRAWKIDMTKLGEGNDVTSAAVQK